MPTSTPSQLELTALQTRNESRLQRARQGAIAGIRGPVEEALSLHQEAGRVQEQTQAYDANTDGFRERAHNDRRDWQLLRIFWMTIIGYVVIEWMTSGDVASMIANSMAPHFGLDAATGDTPIWLRRVAGASFVLAMLLATLLTKLITGHALKSLKSTRTSLLPGEEARYRGLTWSISGVYACKVAYVVAIASLYVWLYGFAKQRAAFMADIANEQRQTTEMSGVGFKLEDGGIKEQASSPVSPPNVNQSDAVKRLSGATGVFYTLIVLLHLLVLMLPVAGFSRPLDLRHFQRSKAGAHLNNVMERRNQTLRNIYETVRVAPEQYRDDLVNASEPVHGLINAIYRRRVIGIEGVTPGMPSSTVWHENEENGAPSDSESMARSGFNSNQKPAAYDEPDSRDSANTGWDEIFPTRTA